MSGSFVSRAMIPRILLVPPPNQADQRRNLNLATIDSEAPENHDAGVARGHLPPLAVLRYEFWARPPSRLGRIWCQWLRCQRGERSEEPESAVSPSQLRASACPAYKPKASGRLRVGVEPLPVAHRQLGMDRDRSRVLESRAWNSPRPLRATVHAIMITGIVATISNNGGMRAQSGSSCFGVPCSGLKSLCSAAAARLA